MASSLGPAVGKDKVTETPHKELRQGLSHSQQCRGGKSVYWLTTTTHSYRAASLNSDCFFAWSSPWLEGCRLQVVFPLLEPQACCTLEE